jgi:hypothetical protein
MVATLDNKAGQEEAALLALQKKNQISFKIRGPAG